MLSLFPQMYQQIINSSIFRPYPMVTLYITSITYQVELPAPAEQEEETITQVYTFGKPVWTQNYPTRV